MKDEDETMKATEKRGLKINSGIKAGGIPYLNHNRRGLKVAAGVKAGSYICLQNHNSRLISA